MKFCLEELLDKKASFLVRKPKLPSQRMEGAKKVVPGLNSSEELKGVDRGQSTAH